MGAGDTPAGAAPAGLDPAVASSPPRNVRPPQALFIDGVTRDVPLDTNGRYAEVDPVDHRVALALFTTLAAIPSAAEIGNTLDQARIDDQAPLQRDVETRVRAALQDELDAQNIAIVTITASVTVRWRIGVTLVYQNLRLPGAPQRTLST
jgi:hypothetical protein